MKILIAVHSFLPAQGGIENHVYQISKEFVANSNSVLIITSSEKNTKKEEIIDGIKIKRFFKINCPFFSSVNFPILAFFEMLKQDPDIYVSHGYGSIMPILSSLAAFIKRKPFVFTLHGYPEIKGKKRFFYYIYKLFMAPIFLNIAKKIIIVSKASKSKIEQEVNQNKLIYIPNGVSEDFSCLEDYTKKNNISYIGRLDEDKQVHILINVFAKLKKRDKLGLLIVGKDEGVKTKLQNLAYKLNVDAKFLVLGYEKIKQAYCDSKLIVLPSRYEGFSLVWLEAMACGRPIFSSKVGDAEYIFKQAYKDKKDLFLFETEQELLEKLEYFLENETKYIQTIKNASEFVKKEYSWKKIGLQTLEIYKEVLENKK